MIVSGKGIKVGLTFEDESQLEQTFEDEAVARAFWQAAQAVDTITDLEWVCHNGHPSRDGDGQLVDVRVGISRKPKPRVTVQMRTDVPTVIWRSYDGEVEIFTQAKTGRRSWPLIPDGQLVLRVGGEAGPTLFDGSTAEAASDEEVS